MLTSSLIFVTVMAGLVRAALVAELELAEL